MKYVFLIIALLFGQAASADTCQVHYVFKGGFAYSTPFLMTQAGNRLNLMGNTCPFSPQQSYRNFQASWEENGGTIVAYLGYSFPVLTVQQTTQQFTYKDNSFFTITPTVYGAGCEIYWSINYGQGFYSSFQADPNNTLKTFHYLTGVISSANLSQCDGYF
ncbi:MAG: hypothetical protein KC483_10820 [Nitrosarchaeum sp.]|nr:hypothetical protein [Nitrosarchaeum sp.]